MSGTSGYAEAFVVAGEYNPTPPAPTPGQKIPFQTDSAGNLLVNVATTVAPSSHITADAGNGTFNTKEASLPAAAALSDTLANPTTTEIGANLLGWETQSGVWRRLLIAGGSNAAGTPNEMAGAGVLLTAGSATQAPAAGPWNSSTTIGNNLTINCLGYSSVVVYIQTSSGTFSAGQVKFQANIAGGGAGSGLGLSAGMRFKDGSTSQLYDASSIHTFASNETWIYWFQTNGADSIKITLTTQISGTGTVVLAGRATTGTVTAPTTVGQSDPTVLKVTPVLYTDPVTTVAPRTPNIFHTASVSGGTSGNSAVWTPTSGKKFRLLKFQVTGVNLAATNATVITLSFQDAASGLTIGTYDVLLPAVANVVSGVTNISGGWIDLGEVGILSAAANNALNLNVSSAPAGATGSYRVNVAGTEE